MRISDWISDVCSSDLDANVGLAYTSSHISVNVAVNNLFTRQDDYLMQLTPNLYANVKYRIASQDMEITPMVAYRQMPQLGRHPEDNTELDPKIGRASCRERVCQYV